MFICGSGSFSNQDEGGDHEAYASPCPTPKRSRRSTSFCRILGRDSGSKNPYADRGLEKFYALLADLDDKKQKIYMQRGSEEISFVRFVYTGDSDVVKPIVVKLKEKNLPKSAKNFTDQSSFNSAATPIEAKSEKSTRKKRSLRCKGSLKIEDLKQPHFYFPVMVFLILVFLAIYGRSFAILCTSIGWYLAPTIAGGSGAAAVSSERKPKRKKEYVRGKSEKIAVVNSVGPSSPKSVINGLN
ncbi:hypothetical protein SASPL_137181 [Salvia splendens]|uniref:Uncharacterized protein n=1 Tax=Salvia splendens TaxID=180675 RepID=A0A8X8WT88_SALSN|nr:uncharacterized protein LOC121763971 [Salvia splendens]KAG6400354.1 hypothetical protein SASPL_137181 [Salvia splendens]